MLHTNTIAGNATDTKNAPAAAAERIFRLAVAWRRHELDAQTCSGVQDGYAATAAKLTLNELRDALDRLPRR